MASCVSTHFAVWLASHVGINLRVLAYLRMCVRIMPSCVETLVKEIGLYDCTKKMPVLSKYAKQRIVAFKRAGVNYGDVVYALRKEEINTSRQTVRQFYLRYLEDGMINQHPGSGRPLKLAEDSLAMVEQLMRQDDETTATQIYSFLVHNGVDVSLTTILRGRRTLGWTFEDQPTVSLFER